MNAMPALDAIDRLSNVEVTRLIEALTILEEDKRRAVYRSFFPDDGPYRRDLYEKHLKFFRDGGDKRERLFMAANRSGKTVSGAVETNFHLTGRYPDWWEGRRFDRATSVWVAGDTNETARDILQKYLLGEQTFDKRGRKVLDGVGVIPHDTHGDVRWKVGNPNLVDHIAIRHVSGGWSNLAFKSYDQGRRVFQGTAKDVIWLDEECPRDVYEECVYRTATTNGLIMLTFTPINGMTQVVRDFMDPPADMDTSHRSVTTVGLDDVPHIDEKTRKELEASTLPHLRDARLKGLPSMSEGAVYPVKVEDITCAPFQIPEHFARGYGFDLGWKRTAAVFCAHDRDADVIYAYSEHYQGNVLPSAHAAAIKARGEWLRGESDIGTNLLDGKKAIEEYAKLGLNLRPAEKAVEAGIMAVHERLSTGRLKIFSTCQNLLKEYRYYERDDKGRIKKENDHALDALRYAVMGVGRFITKPVDKSKMSTPMRRPIDGKAGY